MSAVFNGADCIVVVAGTPWDGVRCSERHLSAQLSRHRPILWVDPPVSMARARRGGQRGVLRNRLEQVGERTARLIVTTVPGVTRRGLRDVAAAQCRRAVREALAELGAQAAAVIVAGTADLLDCVPGALRIFYGTDDFVAGAELMGLQTGWVEQAERRQLAKADIVLAVSETLRDRWAGMGARPLLLPNGADVAAMSRVEFVRPAANVHLPSPVAGLVGHVSERIDLDLLVAVAERGVSLLIVGPSPRTSRLPGLDRLLAMPGVYATGPKPFSELPSYYRHMDVGLTPYTDTAFNRASFPLKTLEYLAAGLPVVASDLPANAHLRPGIVRVGRTPAAFADQVVEAAAEARDPVLVRARRAEADAHSWQRRASQVLALLDAANPPMIDTTLERC